MNTSSSRGNEMKNAIPQKSQTDWERLRAMTDKDINFPDSPELTPEMFARAVIRRGCKPSQAIIRRKGEHEMSDLMKRITINPEQCGGRPCIRGMRIRVIDILDLLAGGLTADEVLEELTDLEREDILAALQYAANRLDHPRLAA
jgi:uncharacterized protein (DUF433 family)